MKEGGEDVGVGEGVGVDSDGVVGFGFGFGPRCATTTWRRGKELKVEPFLADLCSVEIPRKTVEELGEDNYTGEVEDEPW